LVDDGPEGALLIDQLAAATECQPEREDTDDCVDESTRDEACS
jgi:hypothetical protein